MQRTTLLASEMPGVCRLGLATRGNGHLRAEDVEWAISRGINYLNWCGRPDGLSRAVSALGQARNQVVIAVQFQARTASDARQEFASILAALRTDYIDILTLYYVESQHEWEEIIAPGGAWQFLTEQKRAGRLKMIGLTGHQRRLAAHWAESGRLDLLMIRYNAAHRGAELDVFPVARAARLPVVTFTGLRWKALLEPTVSDPPDFTPPSPVDCYRFCLDHPDIAVVLTAPSDHRELEQNLALLDDWKSLSETEREKICAHGIRVYEYAGEFW